MLILFIYLFIYFCTVEEILIIPKRRIGTVSISAKMHCEFLDFIHACQMRFDELSNLKDNKGDLPSTVMINFLIKKVSTLDKICSILKISLGLLWYFS